MLLRLSTRTIVAAVLLVVAPAVTVHAREDAWALAESARATLNGMAAETRTRNDYTVVMDAYRTVYHGNPGDLKAPNAVYAVAELLADEGRVLHDAKATQNAIGQFEFLRKQYPRSSLRMPALFAEGEIATKDLQDTKLAREKYRAYLESYPRASQAEDAKAALAALDSGSAPASTVAIVPAPRAVTIAPAAVAETMPAANPNAPIPGPSHDAPERHGAPAMVTGIRHWSTPTYTRVAIDLGDDIRFEAARVPHPDRIYFDLHGTRLAPELVGKSFAVTDDGFLKRIRAAQFSNDVTRVVLDLSDVTEYSAFLLPNPYRLIIDIHGAQKSTTPQPVTDGGDVTTVAAPPTHSSLPPMAPTMGAPLPERPAKAVATVPSTVATHSRSAPEVAGLSQQPGNQKATDAPTSKPISATVVPKKEIEAQDRRTSRHTVKTVAVAAPASEAMPTADGERSLVRALGLKIGRIVIDAGHGGHDSGTLGAGGIMEKDVVLDVALRLGGLLHERLGSEIIYTRSDDTFIPLETRTAIANKAQADLFISIHANSSQETSARGVEVYYLNFTSQPDALEVAARENAVSDQSIHQLADLVKKITLKDKIDESREFATDVDQSLFAGLQAGNAGMKNRGVKKAPFVVLIGANMPSILAEISFVTNPQDAQELQTPRYRQRVAESLYRGVAKYANGLSGMRVAEASRPEAGGGY